MVRKGCGAGLAGPDLVAGWAGCTHGKGRYGPPLLAALSLLKQISLNKGLNRSLNLIPFQIQTTLKRTPNNPKESQLLYYTIF
jgi:hypothetical protein